MTAGAGDVMQAVAELRTADAVRRRCGLLYAAARAGDLGHVGVDASAWDRVLTAVAAQVTRSYPAGPIPVHGRLNHLRGEGWDLATPLREGAGGDLVDAVVVSVLLDAGAGPQWAFDDPVAGRRGRSEGLAVAAHRLVESGLLSGDRRPFGVDADGLQALTAGALADAFQVHDDNPLVGLAGRVALLNELGKTIAASGADSLGALLHRDLLDAAPDPGHGAAGLDAPRAAASRSLAAPRLLTWILDTLADLWPGRLTLAGHNLGDTWNHPMAGGEGATAGLVPFHKLSQWLTYSLVEPLAHLGVTVTELDGLTGLAEYRNGGMLIELGLLVLHQGLPDTLLPPDAPLIIEWRAATVGAMDQLATDLRPHLPPGRQDLSMGELLEAGTWPLGRRLAYQRAPDGSPPIRVDSDGTVF